MNSNRVSQQEISTLSDLQEYYSLSREKHHLEQKLMERELTSWEFERLGTLPAELEKAKAAVKNLTLPETRKRSSGYFNLAIDTDNNLSKFDLSNII